MQQVIFPILLLSIQIAQIQTSISPIEKELLNSLIIEAKRIQMLIDMQSNQTHLDELVSNFISDFIERNLIPLEIYHCLESRNFFPKAQDFKTKENAVDQISTILICLEQEGNIFEKNQMLIQQDNQSENKEAYQAQQHILQNPAEHTIENRIELNESVQAQQTTLAQRHHHQLTTLEQNLEHQLQIGQRTDSSRYQEQIKTGNNGQRNLDFTITLYDQAVAVGQQLVYVLPDNYEYTGIATSTLYTFDGTKTFTFAPGFNKPPSNTIINMTVRWIFCTTIQLHSFVLQVTNQPPKFEQALAVFRIPINSINTYHLTTRAVDPEGNTVTIEYHCCNPVIVNCNDPLSFVANTSANNTNATTTVSYNLFDGYNTVSETLTIEVYNLPPVLAENEVNVSIEAGKSKFLQLNDPTDERPLSIIKNVFQLTNFTTVSLNYNMVFFQVPVAIPDQTQSLIIGYSDNYNEPTLLTINVHFMNMPPKFTTVIESQSFHVGINQIIPFPGCQDPESNALISTVIGCSFCQYDSLSNNNGILVELPFSRENQTLEVTLQVNDGYYSANQTFNLTIINEPPKDYGNLTVNHSIIVNQTDFIEFPNVSTSDPEGNCITVTLEDNPPFVSVEGQTIWFKPTYSTANGTYSFYYIHSDGYHAIKRTITFDVQNDPPCFNVPFNNIIINVNVGHYLHYSLPNSQDPENNTNSIILPSDMPSFIQLDSINNALFFSPPFTEGPQNITFSFHLSDGFHEVPYSFDLKVINFEPLFNASLNDLQIQAGHQGFYLLPDIIDNEGNANVNFSTDSSFITFNETTSIISYNPKTTEKAGFHIITLFLNDGFHSIKHMLVLRVINEHPFFNGSFIKSIEIPIGSSYLYQIPTPIDPENNTLSITITGLPYWVEKLGDQLLSTQLSIKPPNSLIPKNYSITVNITDGVNNVSESFEIAIVDTKPDFLNSLGDIYCNIELDCTTFNLPKLKDSKGNNVTISKIVSTSNIVSLNDSSLILASNINPGKYIIELTLAYSGFETAHSFYLYAMGPISTNLSDFSLFAYGDQQYSLSSLIPSDVIEINCTKLGGPEVISYSFNNASKTFTFSFGKDYSQENQKLSFKIRGLQRKDSSSISLYFYQNFIIQMPQKVIQKAEILSSNISEGKMTLQFSQNQEINKKIIAQLQRSDFLINIPSRPQKKPIQFQFKKNKDNIEIAINISTIKRNASIIKGAYEAIEVTLLREIQTDDNQHYLYLLEKGYTIKMSTSLADIDAINENNSDVQEAEENNGLEVGLGAATAVVVGAGYTIFGTNMAGKIVGSFPLAKLWGMLNSLSYLTTLALIGIYVPEKQMNVLMSIFNFAQLDALSSDILLENFPGEEAGIPYNDHFNQMGFGSRDLVANMQSAFFYLSAYLLLKLLQLLLQHSPKGNIYAKLKCESILGVLQKLDQNFFIRFFIQQYLTIYISCVLNLFVVSAEEAGHAFSTITTFIIFPFLIIVPFILSAIIYWKKNEIASDDFQDSYGSAVEKLNDDSQWALHWNVFLLLKYQVTILILVFLVDIPFLQILLIQLMSIATMGYILAVWPFSENLLNIQELVNEILVILFCICQYPLAFVSPETINANQLTQIDDTQNLTSDSSLRLRVLATEVDQEQQSQLAYNLNLTQEIGSWGLVGIVYFSALFGMGIVINQMFRNYKELKENRNAAGFKDLMNHLTEYLKQQFQRNKEKEDDKQAQQAQQIENHLPNVNISPEGGNPQQDTSRGEGGCGGGEQLDKSSVFGSNQADHHSLLPSHRQRTKISKMQQQQNLIESSSHSESTAKPVGKLHLNKTVSINPLEETKIPEAENSLEALEEEKQDREVDQNDNDDESLDIFNFKFGYINYKKCAVTEHQTSRSNSSSQTPFKNAKFSILNVQSSMNNLNQQGSRVNFIGNPRHQYDEEEEIKQQVFFEERPRVYEALPRQQSVVSGITLESSAQMLQRNRVSLQFGTTPLGRLQHFSSLNCRFNQESSESLLLPNQQHVQEEEETDSNNSSELPQKKHGFFVTQMVGLVQSSRKKACEDLGSHNSVQQDHQSFESRDQETTIEPVQEPFPPQGVDNLITSRIKRSKKGKKRRKIRKFSKKQKQMGIAYRDGIRTLKRTIRWLNQLTAHP